MHMTLITCRCWHKHWRSNWMIATLSLHPPDTVSPIMHPATDRNILPDHWFLRGVGENLTYCLPQCCEFSVNNAPPKAVTDCYCDSHTTVYPKSIDCGIHRFSVHLSALYTQSAVAHSDREFKRSEQSLMFLQHPTGLRPHRLHSNLYMSPCRAC